MIDFETLYERHARDVFRFAWYLCGNQAKAEDIASETFVRVWTARNNVRLTTVKAYLFTIARNLYLQGLRTEGRHSELDEDHPDPAPDPHQQTTSRDELRTVLAALQSLPEADRSALLMRAQDGLPYEEIAAALRLSLPAVKVKVHRARLRLAAAREGRRSTP